MRLFRNLSTNLSKSIKIRKLTDSTTIKNNSNSSEQQRLLVIENKLYASIALFTIGCITDVCIRKFKPNASQPDILTIASQPSIYNNESQSSIFYAASNPGIFGAGFISIVIFIVL